MRVATLTQAKEEAAVERERMRMTYEERIQSQMEYTQEVR